TFADLRDAARTNALDVLEKDGALLNNLERAPPEDFDNAVGKTRSDALDQSGTEVFLDPLGRAWCQGTQAVGLKLRAVLGVLLPLAGRFHEFAGHRAGCLADDGDQRPPSLDQDAQHDKTVFRIVKGDSLDGARKRFA